MRSALLITALGATLAQAVDLDALRVKASAKYTKSADAAASGLRRFKRADYLETATDLVKSVVPDATFRVVDDHHIGSNGIGHVYFHQTVHGLDIDNAVFNVNIGKDGSVFSYGNSFYEGELPTENPTAKRDSMISAVEALDIVRQTLELPIEVSSDASIQAIVDEEESFTIQSVVGAEEDPETKLVYVVKPNGELTLSWRVSTVMRELSYSSYVDVEPETAEVVAVLDHVDHWSYEVYPFPINNPWEGERVIVEDPAIAEASKLGWHHPLDSEGLYTTRGNNIRAGAFPSDALEAATSSNESFIFPFTPDIADPSEHRDAAVTQAWYLTNMLHDIYYQLGFTPAAGNYQENNNGEGGRENDWVVVRIQHHDGMNNGLFRQAIDGRRPELTMYLFSNTDPLRDGAWDNGFVIHEYTHGLSDRMTGGPLTAGCLDAWEADGMAEGWSDLYAAALMIKPEENRDTATYGFAAWPLNATNPPTARRRMYSTNMTINEYTYESVNGRFTQHEVGHVWATMLYEVLWNLIDKYGKNDGPIPELVDGIPTDGKFLTLKLVMDAFAIQPCNPSIVQARDAIIDADVALTGGENLCEIWTGFAKRGLGAGGVTADPRVDDFDMPEGVC